MVVPAPFHIGLFDSGLGGLSVLEALQKKLDDVGRYRFLYLADHAHYPYGQKAAHILQNIVKENLRRMDESFGLDLAVIACNTASTHVLDAIRQEFGFPIVGVVPAVKPAASLSLTKIIGLLATPTTLSGSYTDSLLQAFASGVRVLKLAAPDLVDLAEQKMMGLPVGKESVSACVKPLLDQMKQGHKMDVLVLGCTHFPLLKEELSEVFGDSVTLLDSGEAIASRVAFLLDSLIAKRDGKCRIEKDLFMSSSCKMSSEKIEKICKGYSLDFFSISKLQI